MAAERIIFQGTLGSWLKATGLAAAAQCSLSWVERCYVNLLLFWKWGRSPSYEQNAPHCHALAPFQDVFHLHSWFGSVQWTNPLNSWPHIWFEWSKWCIEWHLLAMSPCRKINSWKMSLPECRFVGMRGWLLLVCVFYVSLRVTMPHSWSQCIPPIQSFRIIVSWACFFTLSRNFRYFETGRILILIKA